MSLAVLGAGFGRTGTLSLKLALEQLGFGPCYHMLEVSRNPGHAEAWSAAARGERLDWDRLFADYRSAVDWPVCHFWRELSARYPEAKVILTVRSPESWYRSISQTIYRALSGPLPEEPVARAQREMTIDLILRRTFDSRLDDPAHAIEVYERHNAAVREGIPPERLLEFEAAQGWERLCRFLGVPVPDAPYPQINSTAEFQERLAARS